MREIKFRAYTGDTMYYHNDYIKEYKQFDLEESCRLYFLPMSCVMGDCNDWRWMRYTGLKDRNEKEIYEGDIISWLSPGLVEFKYGMFMVGQIDLYLHVQNKCVILGNIYENPELLEE